MCSPARGEQHYTPSTTAPPQGGAALYPLYRRSPPGESNTIPPLPPLPPRGEQHYTPSTTAPLGRLARCARAGMPHCVCVCVRVCVFIYACVCVYACPCVNAQQGERNPSAGRLHLAAGACLPFKPTALDCRLGGSVRCWFLSLPLVARGFLNTPPMPGVAVGICPHALRHRASAGHKDRSVTVQVHI